MPEQVSVAEILREFLLHGTTTTWLLVGVIIGLGGSIWVLYRVLLALAKPK